MNNIKTKILVVEDNKVVQLITKDLLEDADCQVDMAETGKQALLLAGSNYYRFILMDIGLEDISGFEASTKIKKEKLSKNPDVKIIALSAHVSDDYKQQAFSSGMEVFLAKPLTTQNIKEILAECD